MNVTEYYHHELQQRGYQADEAQLRAVALLDVLQRGRLAIDPLQLQGSVGCRLDVDQTCIESCVRDELRRAHDARAICFGTTDGRNRAGSSDGDEDFIGREHVGSKEG